MLRYVRVFSERLFHDHICLVVSTHGQKHMSQRATNHPKSRLNILNYNYSDLLQEAGIYWEKKHIRGGRALKRTPTKSKRHLLEGPGPEPRVLPLLSSCARPVSQKAALARFFFSNSDPWDLQVLESWCISAVKAGLFSPSIAHGYRTSAVVGPLSLA